MKKQPTYIRDTTDFIHKIEGIKVSSTAILAVLDLQSMYSNTLHNEAISSISQALECEQIEHINGDILNQPPTESMLKLLNLILKNNTFRSYDNTYYKQSCGVTMGSCSSPEIADITFHVLEKRILSIYQTQIDLWFRFRDDIFMVYNGTQMELDSFHTEINRMHQTFKFTIESSEKGVTYLDLQIFKGQRHRESGILDIRTHTKQTDTFQFLHRESCHPKATFSGFLKGEILRYIRTCSNITDFNSKVKLFTEKLQTRGYTENEISQITKDIKYTNRTSILDNKSNDTNKDKKLVFTTKFNPGIKTSHLKQALLQNWDKIEQDKVLGKLFPEKPLIAYKREKNLKDTLVRAKLNKTTAQETKTSQNGSHPHQDPNIDILASLLEEQETEIDP